MKTVPSIGQRRAGFTLVELLVVIAIIVILVGLSFVGITSAMNSARKVSALNAATGLEHAIDAYYNTYGALPVDSAAPFTTADSTGKTLLAILTAKEAGPTLKNPRKIVFFTGKEVKVKRDGLYYSAGVPDGLYDPWGNAFTVVLDNDYDQVINVSIPQANIPNATDDGVVRNRNAIIYSLGKNPSATPIPPKDLVRSWAQ